ncbi:MAG: hypothetical protein ACJ8IR_06440 [Alphaproteobacteria bacterium]|jgi:hypothetical protein
MARAFDLLPAPERARRYREMAKAALHMAEDAPTSEDKASYISLSASWHSLATSLEREPGEDALPATRDGLTANTAADLN